METPRPSFRTSITARLVWVSLSFALIAGGLVALHGSPSLIPYSFAPAIVGCFVALILGVEEHPAEVLGLLIALPLLLFPWVMLLHLIVIRWSSFGSALVVAGFMPLLATVSAGSLPAKRSGERPADGKSEAPMPGTKTAIQH